MKTNCNHDSYKENIHLCDIKLKQKFGSTRIRLIRCKYCGMIETPQGVLLTE